MTNSKKQVRPKLTLKKEVTFEVYRPEMEVAQSLEFLDFKKLSSGHHRIGIGSLEGECCSDRVFAKIEDGYVTGVEVEGCEHSEKAKSEEAFQIYATALDLLDVPEFKPEPVAKFLSNLNVTMPPPIGAAGCITICGFGYCIKCCTSPADGTSCSISKKKVQGANGTLLATFKREIEFEVYEPEIEVLPAARFLDPEKLSRGKQRVEIGSIEAECCRNAVFTLIEDGEVVSFEAAGCDSSEGLMPDEASQLFAEALTQLDFPERKPIPVRSFLASLSNGITIEVSGCFWICAFGYCLFCCTGDVITSGKSKCWIEERKSNLAFSTD